MVLHFAEELKLKRKKELKKDNASKIKALVDEVSNVFFCRFFMHSFTRVLHFLQAPLLSILFLENVSDFNLVEIFFPCWDRSFP